MLIGNVSVLSKMARHFELILPDFGVNFSSSPTHYLILVKEIKNIDSTKVYM